MKFFSTKNSNNPVSFQEAVFRSLPPDNGLYFPENIPQLEREWILSLPDQSLKDIGFQIARQFVQGEIDEDSLKTIIAETLDFEIPLVSIEKDIYVLELFHGPTWAFKDVGARFLARTMGYFTRKTGEEITILVATSGDTGGAVAAGFHNVPGVNVVILFPKGKVSEVQQMQLTTWGDNITAVEIEGNFDDCQRLVKSSFLDSELNDKFNLSSANSINIARLIPQTFYYFWLYSQRNQEMVISVPSGNYGNLTAGILAHKMGLPVKRFIAASNVNKIVPEYLETGTYRPRDSVQTYSNAMDVGSPSNFVRLSRLFKDNYSEVCKKIEGFWLDDEGTLSTMRNCHKRQDYILDPHGAIGYQALKDKLKPGEEGVFLETAHPVKFQPVLDKAFDEKISYPEKVEPLLIKKSEFETMKADFEVFKGFLLS